MASSHFSAPSPPMFDGNNYPVWAIKMRSYLQAYDLWELVEVDYEVEPLRAGATVNQIKLHSEENARPYKTLTAIQVAVTDDIFTRIMTCTTPRQAWKKVQEEFQGSTRSRQMQLLNLRREFKNMKMLEHETMKEFSNKLMKIVNQIRLHGEFLPDQRIVEKILICLLEKYEVKISTLEETRDLTQLRVAELINALQATEQRRSLRLQGESSSSEAAFAANNNGKSIQQPRPFQRQNRGKEITNQRENKMTYDPCIICKKQGHTAKICWWRPKDMCHHA
ncbi:uncharacterized protein LOC132799484 [Ziziphus jujuba]|uniref:Uncharacterized protein LOC132799484 n=1 Tax=Ziziphus jujuba TaxID=326968 RepID=A0ABM3ZSI9_ZIZJJ|nr:uncharacterized protein LOC132799484 [Ziziphus jujuba]